MRIRSRHKSILAGAAVAVAVAGVPADAIASHADEPFNVVATIAACRGESLTIAAQVTPSADVPPLLREATLKLRFEAAPLHGATRKSREFDLGRTMNARRSVRFADLPAHAYGGVVRYRWVRGKRTVASGFVRTRRAQVSGRQGKAFCSLRVGRPPTDTQPPFIAPFPSDTRWYRGPLTVNFFVFDDLSGVAVVFSRIDGGSFVIGRRRTITGEGPHLLEYGARDAAGNQTPTSSVTLRVDENPPTTPAVSAPSGTTTDSTPDIQWSASTDSASGVAGYFVLVRDSAGAIVWSQILAPSATTATVGQALGPGNYTAEVIAVDGALPMPFTATGSSAFTVAPPPDADGDGVADADDNCPSIPNTSQADVDSDRAGNPCDDSDSDGLTDDAEINGNPQTLWNDADTDNDGVLDGAEAGQGTSPTDPDSDDDTFDDSEDPCPTQPDNSLFPDGCP